MIKMIKMILIPITIANTLYPREDTNILVTLVDVVKRQSHWGDHSLVDWSQLNMIPSPWPLLLLIDHSWMLIPWACQLLLMINQCQTLILCIWMLLFVVDLSLTTSQQACQPNGWLMNKCGFAKIGIRDWAWWHVTSSEMQVIPCISKIILASQIALTKVERSEVLQK